jgi:hypothetical protein
MARLKKTDPRTQSRYLSHLDPPYHCEVTKSKGSP